MAVCFVADCKHNNREDQCKFYRFSSNTKEYQKWEDSIYQMLIPPKKELTCAIAIVNKKSREPHCVI